MFVVAVVDPVKAASGKLEIANILGFFIAAPMAGPPSFGLTGILVTQPGLFSGGFGGVPNAASFLKVIQLIR